MFGPLPVPGKGVGGRKRDNPRRGEVHTEGKTWRGGLWIFQRRTCCVVAGCHRHDYPNKLYRYQGEGRGRLAPIIVKSNLEPWLAARFLLLYLNFSFHSCAGIILRRDVEGGGEKIRRLNDSDRSLTRYGKKENIVIGWIRVGKVQRTEAVWKNLFSRNGFGRIRGGCRWFKMARSEWYIYIKFVENFLVRKL